MSNSTEQNFAQYIKEVALLLFGEPSEIKRNEYRFGNKGSLSVDLAKGVWNNFETGQGGGVLDLIAIKKKISKRQAVDWLKDNGFDLEDTKKEYFKPKSEEAPKEVTETKTIEQASSFFLKKTEPQLVATYDYISSVGEVLYQVLRFEITENGKTKKTFKQRKPDLNGGWEYSVKGVSQVPYRLDDLIEAIALGKTIYIVEGEKDVETLKKHGITATTNSGGSNSWPSELNGFFATANVTIIPDNDEAGRKHAQIVATSLKGTAHTIKLLELPDLPEKGDVTDWFNNGGTVENFYTLASKAIPYSGEQIFKTKFSALRWSELDKPGLEHEWLIKGLLTRGERSMVAGPSQSGKSFAVLDLALSISRGVDYQAYAQIGGDGPFNVRNFKTKKGLVIYQCGEGSRGLKKRLKAYRKHHNIESNQDLPFVLLPAAVDLHSNEEHTQELITEIKHWASLYPDQLELVVIDTLSAATPGANENDSADVSRILARCEKIAHECNCHVMFVHHMNAANEKPRGHTSIFANLDNVLTLKRLEEKEPPREYKKSDGITEIYPGRDIREITVTKSKDGEDGTKIRFVLQSIELGQDQDGDKITSCVCIMPEGLEGTNTTTDKAIKLNDELLLTLKALKQALDEHGIPPPKESLLPSNLTVVDYKIFRNIYSELSGISQSDFSEEKRKEILENEIRKYGKVLLVKGVIARDKNYIWFTGKSVQNFFYKPSFKTYPRLIVTNQKAEPENQFETPWKDK